MKIQAIIHGRSSQREAITKDLANLVEGNHDLEISFTERGGHAEELAKKSSADLILSCGGDGTNHDVVNGLMTKQADQRPILGLVKAGSGNDFLRILEQSSLSNILRSAESGQTKRVDVISIEFEGKQRFALNMCTCGISGSIAKTVNERKFKLPPAFNYYSAIIQWLLKYRSSRLRISSEYGKLEDEFFLLAFGNGKYAGNGLGLSPQSDAFNGILGLTTIGNVSVFDFLRYQSTLKKCHQIKDPRVDYSSTKKVEIEVLSGEIDAEADGETIATFRKGQSFKVSAIPAALELLT